MLPTTFNKTENIIPIDINHLKFHVPLFQELWRSEHWS